MSDSEEITFQSAKFGEVTINRGAVVTFSHGLPGFERYRQYGLVAVEEEAPFLRLLCLEEPRVSFVMVDPMLVWNEYNPNIVREELDGLGIASPEEMALYCMVTLSSTPDEVTVNLKGPLCINTQTMQGKQLILVDDSYHTKHSIMAVAQEQ